MKKTLLMAAACVALVSCVKDEVAVTNMAETSNSKITFEAPLITPGTRALIDTDEAYPITEDFTVIGLWYENGYTTFAQGTPYMGSVTNGVGTGLLAEYQGTPDADGNVSTGEAKNYWATEKDYFWPKNGSLTFQAFSPASLATTVATFTASGVKFDNYAIPTSHDVDVLFSERSYDRKASNNTASTTDWKNPNNYAGVDIRFRHALSSIKFTAQYNTDGDNTDATIALTNISLLNMDNTGDYTQGLADTPNALTPDYAEATNASYRHWTIDTSINAVNYTNIMSENSHNVVVTNDDATEDSYKVKTNDLIVMPQVFRTAAEEGRQPQMLSVTYEYNGVSNTVIVNLADLSYSGNDDNTNKGFEVGKQYVFNISIGLNKIYFAPVVADWKEVTVTGTI